MVFGLSYEYHCHSIESTVRWDQFQALEFHHEDEIYSHQRKYHRPIYGEWECLDPDEGCNWCCIDPGVGEVSSGGCDDATNQKTHDNTHYIQVSRKSLSYVPRNLQDFIIGDPKRSQRMMVTNTEKPSPMNSAEPHGNA